MEMTFYLLSCINDLSIILFSMIPNRGRYFYSNHRHCVYTRFDWAHLVVLLMLVMLGISFRTIAWELPGAMERRFTSLTLNTLTLCAFFFYFNLCKLPNYFSFPGFTEEKKELGLMKIRTLVEAQLTKAGYAKACYSFKNHDREIRFNQVPDHVVALCMMEIDDFLESQRCFDHKKFYYMITLLWTLFFIYDLGKVVWLNIG